MNEHTTTQETNTIQFQEHELDTALIVERMKTMRIQKGITQNQIADSLDVTSAYISNVENAKTRLNLRVLLYYAQLLDVSVDFLLNIEDRNDPIDYQILGQLKNYTPAQKYVLFDFIRNFPK